MKIRQSPGFTSTTFASLLMFAMAAVVQGAENEGWIEALEGGDLKAHLTTEGNWKLDDQGVARLTPRPGETDWTRYNCYLWSKEDLRDFEAEFEYRLQPKGNSGFYFHVADPADPVKTGVEVQIIDAPHRKPNAPLNNHDDTGGLLPGPAPTARSAKPAGEWNHLHIACKGNQLTVELNGEVVNRADLSQPPLKARPEAGRIGIQDHGLPLEVRKLRFRSLN